MFRLMRLKPPNGWSGLAWELAVVTVGVLIALVAQQQVDNLSMSSKAQSATEGLRDELGRHYRFAVEWRVVEPCINAQIERLSGRLIASRDRIDPAPVYSEPGFDFYVLRMPNRAYDRGSWDAAVADGVTTHFDRVMRDELNTAYTRVNQLNEATSTNNVAYPQLFGSSRPLPIDSGSRLAFLRTLDELRGRVELMSLISGQIIGNIERAGLAPDTNEVRTLVEHGGTRQFCRSQGLAMRDFNEAIRPIAE